jgi:hypothetical protein
LPARADSIARFDRVQLPALAISIENGALTSGFDVPMHQRSSAKEIPESPVAKAIQTELEAAL